jgi:hypothetical protein
MNEYENEFDDPGFKAAVRRTVGRETAPPSMRAKVQSLLAAEAAAAAASADAGHANGEAPATSSTSSPAASPPRGRRRFVIDRTFWRTAAAAACLLLALGWMAYQIRENVFPNSIVDGRPTALPAIPASIALDMVRTHDACAKLEDHHKLKGDDLEALRTELSDGSKVTATVVSLGGDWKFRGAGICDVGGTKAAHLLFVRADEYASIFSMPASAECGYGTDAYNESIEKHAVAGFRHGDALYCVVASNTKREATRDDINPLLEKVQGAVVSGCMTQETMVATAAAATTAHQHQ